MFIQTAVRQRSKHKQDLREVILAAARYIFVQEGYEGFSMRKLARKIRYSPGSIYLHFKNKQQLFDSLVEESFTHLHAAMVKLRNAEAKRRSGGNAPKRTARICRVRSASCE